MQHQGQKARCSVLLSFCCYQLVSQSTGFDHPEYEVEHYNEEKEMLHRVVLVMTIFSK